MSEKLIAVFLKLRNGILRGDLYNCLLNIEQYADTVFVVDDASYDGTTDFLKTIIPDDQLIVVPQEEHSFAKELYWKEELMKLVHKKGPFSYILWMDSDEVLDKKGTENIREFCKKNLNNCIPAWKFHYTQFWRNTSYARTDDGFDEGCFIKLWRYRPDLSFSVEEGTHKIQFPLQLMESFFAGKIQDAPFEVLHYGNVGQNLKYKALQYFGGLGGVDRHLKFTKESTYREVSQDIIPENSIKIVGNVPEPFSQDQIDKTLKLENLTKLPNHFCVIVSNYNRHDTLPRAFDSLINQTYQSWHCVICDDGSTDPEVEKIVLEYCDKDPRFFYAKYLEHKGGVAVNERGMEIAINTASWWTRLGSDDWFMPHKLELDAEAFLQGHKAVYSPFVVHRDGVFGEMGNLPVPAKLIEEGFLRGGFFASWASVAVDCQVLEEVKKKYGNFVDPRLTNMEDLLFNYRVSTLVPWIFVSKVEDEFLINPSDEIMKEIMEKKIKLDYSGVWNCVTTGASGNTELYNRDSQLSQQIIVDESRKFAK